MAPTKKVHQYELKVPGVGMSPTRFGTLIFRYTSSNILKLRDALALAAEKLTEHAVKLIEEERAEEIRRLTPPLDADEKHAQRIKQAQEIPNAPRQVTDSIERARTASRRPIQVGGIGVIRGGEKVIPVAQPEQAESENHLDNGAPKVFVSGGFESDDGSLGNPPPSIR